MSTSRRQIVDKTGGRSGQTRSSYLLVYQKTPPATMQQQKVFEKKYRHAEGGSACRFFQRNHFLILYHATQSLPRGGRWAGRKPGSDEGDLPQGIGCVLRQHVKMPFPPWCLASPDEFNLSFETLSSYVGTLRTACATLPSSVRFAATFVQGRFYQIKLSPGQFDPRGRLFYEQR